MQRTPSPPEAFKSPLKSEEDQSLRSTASPSEAVLAPEDSTIATPEPLSDAPAVAADRGVKEEREEALFQEQKEEGLFQGQKDAVGSTSVELMPKPLAMPPPEVMPPPHPPLR